MAALVAQRTQIDKRIALIADDIAALDTRHCRRTAAIYLQQILQITASQLNTQKWYVAKKVVHFGYLNDKWGFSCGFACCRCLCPRPLVTSLGQRHRLYGRRRVLLHAMPWI
jgi:hypothetical protein